MKILPILPVSCIAALLLISQVSAYAGNAAKAKAGTTVTGYEPTNSISSTNENITGDRVNKAVDAKAMTAVADSGQVSAQGAYVANNADDD